MGGIQLLLQVSIVIPVYNEVDNIKPLTSALTEAMEKTAFEYEIICVDDGSTDGSYPLLKKVCQNLPNLRVLKFRQNCGETAALDAGFKAAQGRYVVSMDADLQNDPNDIPMMLEKLKDFDMVCGWRHKRDDPWIKRISSRVANFVRNKLSDENIQDVGTIKAYRKECLDRIKMFKGMHRFLPTLFKIEGFTVIEVKVRHYPRKFGQSKYNVMNRMFVSFVDLLAVRWMKKRRLDYEIVPNAECGDRNAD